MSNGPSVSTGGLALDTAVPTPVGWTLVAQLQPGDTVYGADGNPCNVVSVTEVTTCASPFRVTFDDRTTVIVNPDQQWLAWDKRMRARDGKRRSRMARGLNVRETAQAQPFTVSDMAKSVTAGPETNYAVDIVALRGTPGVLPIPPYVLGAWLGDGTTTSACITVGHGNEFMCDEIRREGVTCDLRPTKNPGAEKYILGVQARGRGKGSFQAALRSLGVLGDKHIPVLYARASFEHRLALLQGLMDTDGNMCRDDQAEIALTNRQLADDVAELIASLGIKVWRDERPAMLNGRACGTAYRSRFRPVFQVFRMPYKVARLRLDGPMKTQKIKRRFVWAIEGATPQSMRAVQVDSPTGQILVTGSFIPALAAEAAA